MLFCTLSNFMSTSQFLRNTKIQNICTFRNLCPESCHPAAGIGEKLHYTFAHFKNQHRKWNAPVRAETQDKMERFVNIASHDLIRWIATTTVRKAFKSTALLRALMAWRSGMQMWPSAKLSRMSISGSGSSLRTRQRCDLSFREVRHEYLRFQVI